jgi:hypothetical protein
MHFCLWFLALGGANDFLLCMGGDNISWSIMGFDDTVVGMSLCSSVGTLTFLCLVTATHAISSNSSSSSPGMLCTERRIEGGHVRL